MFNDIHQILLTLQAPVSPSPTHMWVFRIAVGCHCRAQLCWSITLITNSFSLVRSPVSENNWERQDWLINRKNCVLCFTHMYTISFRMPYICNFLKQSIKLRTLKYENIKYDKICSNLKKKIDLHAQRFFFSQTQTKKIRFSLNITTYF